MSPILKITIAIAVIAVNLWIGSQVVDSIALSISTKHSTISAIGDIN